MSRPRLPWQGVAELLVDGNNLLHALAGGADPGALRLLLARLQATVPPTVRTSIVLDGHPDPGSPGRLEARRGILVRHAGRVTADRALTDEIAGRSVAARAGIVLITNDNELRSQVRRLGARAEPVSWLVQRLGSRPLAPAGRPGPPVSPRPPASAPPSPVAPARPHEDDVERPPWSPGRGATRKRGNPRRAPGRRRRNRPAG